jgi:hypothetical protein
MRRLRWLFFTAALLLLLTTPGAVYTAIDLGRSNQRLIAFTLLALVVRLAVIAWFTTLWWNHRGRQNN